MGKTCRKNSGAFNPVMSEHSYSDGIHHARVLILGPYPPPWGGVAVHIQRVQHKLEEQNNTVVIFDTIARTSFICYLMQLIRILYRNHFDYVIYHTPYTNYSWVEMMILSLYAILKSTLLMLIEHDCRYIAHTSWFKKKMISWFGARTRIIFIGLATYASYKKAGISLTSSIAIESPFLPPDIHKSEQIYPATLMDFIASHQPLLVANAYQCTLFEGADLYGIDYSIAVCNQLQHQFPQIGLVLFLATIGDHDYYRQVVSQLNKQMYILIGDYQLWPIFKYADCFIRPTRNENFGISVAEALYCNIPVVASDACARPSGTIVYQTNQLSDLITKTTHVLQERGS